MPTGGFQAAFAISPFSRQLRAPWRRFAFDAAAAFSFQRFSSCAAFATIFRLIASARRLNATDLIAFTYFFPRSSILMLFIDSQISLFCISRPAE